MADALGSGPSVSNHVGVQLPFSASLEITFNLMAKGDFLLFA